jgi:predicted ATPase/DNA-binding SARP family transcriptional activator
VARKTDADLVVIVAETAAPVHFLDIGELLVETDGATRGPGGARPAALLAVLLIHANRRVPADTVGAAMWEEARPRATSTLESHLWRLRQVLEPHRAPGRPYSVLVTESGGYRLVASTDQVDSLRFTRLVDDAAALLADGRPDRALHRCGEARALWRGRPFDVVADRDWAAPAVARLEEYRAQLGERQADAWLGVGEPERALVQLEVELGEHPLREHLWAQRMLADHRCGRTSDALAAFARVRRLLLDELGTEPGPELRELQRRILAEDPDLARVRTGPPESAVLDDRVHLPRWSSRLVGRAGDLRGLAEAVTRRSLVTVTGPAGTGKTRLAVEAARVAADAFPDGVWFVDLTAASDAGQVGDAVATALGVPVAPTGSRDDALRVFTRDRRMLLLLDDCEHVLDDVADRVEVLRRSGPELAVLATSREPLEVDDEHVFALGPLALPDAEDADPDPRSSGSQGGRAASVELFLERIAARPLVGDDEGPERRETWARRICRAMDGLPLGIELAAARARTFSLAEVADQTEADPAALAGVGRRGGPRATLHAAVERSHRLLDAADQLVHRSVAVLPGPFTVAGAAATAGTAPVRTAEVLADLAHHSLLVPLGPRAPGRPSRFAQLGIVRGHAARALADVDGTDAGNDGRDRWLAELVADRPRLGSPAEAAWFDALDDDLAALRTTLQRNLVDRRSPIGALVVARLGMFWYDRGALLEGRRWTELAVGLVPDLPLGSAALLRLSLAASWGFAGRGDLAAPLCDSGLRDLAAATTTTDEDLVVGDELTVLAGCLWMSGQRPRARTVLVTAAEIAARTGDPILDLLCRLRSGIDQLGEVPPGVLLDRAAVAHTDAVALGNLFGTWFSTVVAQMAAVVAGRPDEALHWSDLGLLTVARTGRTHAPMQLELRGNILALLRRDEEALRLYAAAQAHNDRAGVPWPALEMTGALLRRTRMAVGVHRADHLRHEGARLTVRDLAPSGVAGT